MAAGSASVDTMLADAISKMDALNKRMDALETTTKNPIKGDDDDDKKDDATTLKHKIKDDDDDDDDKKDDAFVAKKAVAKGDDDDDDDKKDDAFPPKKKKDDSKKADAKKADAKKGDDGELEIKHEPEKKKDSKKADASKKSDDDDDDDKKDDAAKKSDDDDDDAKKKDDSVKADDIRVLRKQISDQQGVIDKLQALMKPRSDDEHAAFADAQAKADAVFNGFGKRAPRPMEGEALIDYRKRMATALKPHSTVWKDAKLSKLDDHTFGIAEDAIYADAAVAAANPVDLGAGELRMVTKVDPTTGVRSNMFYGKESFVKGMGRPGRRVQSFRTLASQ